jgi:hypothetical protein
VRKKFKRAGENMKELVLPITNKRRKIGPIEIQGQTQPRALALRHKASLSGQRQQLALPAPPQLALPSIQSLPPQHPLPIIEEPIDEIVPYIPRRGKKKWAPYPPTQAALQSAKTRKSIPQPLPLASLPSTSQQQLALPAPPRRSIKRRGTDLNFSVAKQARNWAQIHPLFARNSVIPNRSFQINLPSPNLALTRPPIKNIRRNGRKTK